LDIGGADGVPLPAGLREDGLHCLSVAENQDRAALQLQLQAEQASLQAQLKAEQAARAALQAQMDTEMQELMSKVPGWLVLGGDCWVYISIHLHCFQCSIYFFDTRVQGRQWNT
jgi:uncharacterized small protein (DUF1192 family)